MDQDQGVFFLNPDPGKNHIFSQAITKISGDIIVFNQILGI